jgi:hypothetical protein
LYRIVAIPLRERIESLFERQGGRRTLWDVVKSELGQPTVKQIKRFLTHLAWLREQAGKDYPLAGIPVVKLQRFASEARALNAARMGELTEDKRHALTNGPCPSSDAARSLAEIPLCKEGGQVAAPVNDTD